MNKSTRYRKKNLANIATKTSLQTRIHTYTWKTNKQTDERLRAAQHFHNLRTNITTVQTRLILTWPHLHIHAGWWPAGVWGHWAFAEVTQFLVAVDGSPIPCLVVGIFFFFSFLKNKSAADSSLYMKKLEKLAELSCYIKNLVIF